MMMTGIHEALEMLRDGMPVFVYDADGREEETDIVFASGQVDREAVRFMRRHGGGLICATVSDGVAENIGLPFLVDIFRSAEAMHPVLRNTIPGALPYDTKSAFSVTINHRKCYTGITDRDRAMTISEFGRLVGEVDAGTVDEPLDRFTASFRIPGHVFLLRTSPEMLRDRFGHTELSTALCIMAGLPPSAAICEMMGDDGNALGKDAAREFAEASGSIFLEGREIVEEWRAWSG